MGCCAGCAGFSNKMHRFDLDTEQWVEIVYAAGGIDTPAVVWPGLAACAGRLFWFGGECEWQLGHTSPCAYTRASLCVCTHPVAGLHRYLKARPATYNGGQSPASHCFGASLPPVLIQLPLTERQQAYLPKYSGFKVSLKAVMKKIPS
jgi:hypothetical protein